MRASLIAVVAATAIVGAAGAAQQQVKTADYKFSCAYPAAAQRYTTFRRSLDADCATVRASIVREVRGARAAAKKGGYPFNPYESSLEWKLVTDTPRFMSLSGDSFTYRGGAHGDLGTRATLWDKQAGRRIDTKSVFVSLAAAEAAVRSAYCRQLDVFRREKRGGPTPAGDMFGACPPLKDLTVLLGSSGGGRINRIGLIADPYVAGPFAEGKYEVTLPVTPALIRAVKPGYRLAFAAR